MTSCHHESDITTLGCVLSEEHDSVLLSCYSLPPRTNYEPLTGLLHQRRLEKLWIELLWLHLHHS